MSLTQSSKSKIYRYTAISDKGRPRSDREAYQPIGHGVINGWFDSSTQTMTLLFGSGFYDEFPGIELQFWQSLVASTSRTKFFMQHFYRRGATPPIFSRVAGPPAAYDLQF